jgi:hypothetical protein
LNHFINSGYIRILAILYILSLEKVCYFIISGIIVITHHYPAIILNNAKKKENQNNDKWKSEDSLEGGMIEKIS